MMEVAARWIVRAVSLLALGPLAAGAAGIIRAPDGSDAVTLLTGPALGPGLLAAFAVGGCVVAAAALGARLADRHEAVLNAGFVLAWVAWCHGSMSEVVRLTPGAGLLVRLSLEAAVVAAAVLVAFFAADRLSRRPADQEGLGLGRSDAMAAMRVPAGPAILLATAAVALASAWLFARHGGAGQGVGTGFLAGFFAGVAGTQIQQSMSARHGVPAGSTGVFIPVLLGIAVASVAAPLIGLLAPGASGLLPALARGELPGWLLVAPTAWLAGGLIGAPMGISMLKSTPKSILGPADAEPRPAS